MRLRLCFLFFCVLFSLFVGVTARAEVDGDGNEVIPIGSSRLLRIADESLATDYVIVDQATGEVGIGNGSPASILHADSNAANTAAILTLENTAGDVQVFRVDATPEGSVTGNTGDLVIDGTSGVMYIKTDDGDNTDWDQLETGLNSLSDVTAATAANSINSGDNPQTWNWSLTTASQSGLNLNENTASTGASSNILKLGTLATSTARTLFIENLGVTDSLLIHDEAGDTTPIVFTADGRMGIGTATPASTVNFLTEDATTNTIADVYTITHRTTGTAAAGFGSAVLFEGENAAGTLVNQSRMGGVWEDATNGSEDGAMVFYTMRNGVFSEQMRLASTGTLAMRTTTPNPASDGASFTFNQMAFWDDTGAFSDFTQRVGGGGWGVHNILAHQGTSAAPTIVNSTQNLGEYVFGGYDGTQFRQGVIVRGAMDGTPGANDLPTRLSLLTTPDGSGTPVERIRITNAGNVGIGDTSPASLFTVGNGDLFQVSSTGDLVKIQNVTYDWPAANAAGVLTNDGLGVLSWSAGSVPADSLDYDDFEDTMDLDAALTLNQTTNTWSQTFTGDTAVGLTYAADSLTSGDAVDITSSSTALTGDLTQVELTGAGAGNTGNVLKVGFTGATGTAVPLNITNAGTGLTARFNDDGTYADSTPVVIDASGNVGIGTDAPTIPLIVSSANSPQIKAYGNGNGAFFSADRSALGVGGAGISFMTAGINYGMLSLATSDNDLIHFLTSGGTERFSINMSTGSVGVGDPSPSSLFVVGNGDLFQVDSTGDLIRIQNVTYDWPAANASGVLTNNGSGVLSWTAASAGDIATVGDCTSGDCFTASGTGDNITGATNDDILSFATDATLTFQRNNAGTVTFAGADDAGAADTVYDTTGAGAITVGSGDVTSVTVTTDSTGNGEVVLPTDSIGTGEILDNTITGTDTADDTFDFVDLEDTLDLDAALTLNQTTNTWSQTFTGTTTVGQTYTANSLTSGDAFDVASSATALTGDLAQVELTGAGAGNTGNVLKVGFTGATGTATALNVTNAGTGLTARFNDDGTYADATPVVVDASGNLGVGDSSPTSLLTVGSGDLFQVNSSGDPVRIKNVTYSWPGANAVGVFQNDGSGNLSWSPLSNILKYYAESSTTPASSPTAGGNYAVAIGDNSQANVDYSYILGSNNSSGATYSFIGGNSNTLNSGNEHGVLGYGNATGKLDRNYIVGSANTITDGSSNIYLLGENQDVPDGNSLIYLIGTDNNAVSSANANTWILGYSNNFDNNNNRVFGYGHDLDIRTNNSDLYLLGTSHHHLDTLSNVYLIGSTNNANSVSNYFAIGNNIDNSSGFSDVIEMGLSDGETMRLDSTGRLTLQGSLNVSGSDGTSGQVLTSQGAGVDPIWSSVSVTADSLDYADFQDTMDLDAALILNQSINTWTQTFIGDTTTGLTYTGDSLTTGRLMNLTSNSANTSTRNLIQMTNDNTAATGATVLSIQQDSTANSVFIDHNGATGNALSIDGEQTTGDVVNIDGSVLTTGNLVQGVVTDTLNTNTALVNVTGTALNAATLVKINELSTTPANDVDVMAVHLERGTDDARIGFDEGVDRWQADNGEGAGLLDMPLILNRAATLNDVVSTNVATALYSFSVPANVMGTTRALRLRILGDYLNNTGVNQTLRLQISFGGTTIYNDITPNVATSANRRPFHFDMMIANQNSASVQFMSGLFALGINGGATTGIGDMATDEIISTTPFSGNGTSAINTTSAQTLTVTVTHSASSANLSVRSQYAILELL